MRKFEIKKLASLALGCLLLIANASTNVGAKPVEDDMRSEQLTLQKQYYSDLKDLGFTDEVIRHLAPQELKEIVSNKYTFVSSSVEHRLAIGADNEYGLKEQIAFVPITEGEFNEYKFNKNKLLKKKITELSVNNPSLKKYIEPNNENLLTTLSSNPVSQYIDGATVTVSVDVYNAPLTGYVRKGVGADFKWDRVPGWLLKECVALGWNGSFWAIESESTGGWYWNGWKMSDLPVTRQGTGISAEYTIDFNYYNNHEGRIYTKIRQLQNVTPRQEYNVFAAYAHSIKGYNISVSINWGAPSLTPGSSTQLVSVTPNPMVIDRTY